MRVNNTYSWNPLCWLLTVCGGAVQETLVRSLRLEDPLVKEMATHSSILAWENSKSRGAWRATVHGGPKSQTGFSN